MTDMIGKLLKDSGTWIWVAGFLLLMGFVFYTISKGPQYYMPHH
jgi:hypothetical protein